MPATECSFGCRREGQGCTGRAVTKNPARLTYSLLTSSRRTSSSLATLSTKLPASMVPYKTQRCTNTTHSSCLQTELTIAVICSRSWFWWRQNAVATRVWHVLHPNSWSMLCAGHISVKCNELRLDDGMMLCLSSPRVDLCNLSEHDWQKFSLQSLQ